MDPLLLLLRDLNTVIPGGIFTVSGFCIGVLIFLAVCGRYFLEKGVAVANIWRATVLEQNAVVADLFDKNHKISENFLRHNEAIIDRMGQQHQQSVNAQVETAKSNILVVDKMNNLLVMLERLCHISTQEAPAAKGKLYDHPKKSITRRSVPASEAKGSVRAKKSSS